MSSTPRDTRMRVAQALHVLRRKAESPLAKKHGNIPL